MSSDKLKVIIIDNILTFACNPSVFYSSSCAAFSAPIEPVINNAATITALQLYSTVKHCNHGDISHKFF